MPRAKKKIKRKSVDFESNLTIQQQAFVNEYVVNFDGHQAALSAGYSEKSAQTQSYQLLQNPKIREAVSKALDQYGLEYDILKKRVLEQLHHIAFSDITNYQEWSGDYTTMKDSKKLTRGQRAAIQQVKVTTVTTDEKVSHSVDFKLCSKEKALELIGRHLNMFTDKIEHIGAVPVVIDWQDGTSTELTTKKKD